MAYVTECSKCKMELRLLKDSTEGQNVHHSVCPKPPPPEDMENWYDEDDYCPDCGEEWHMMHSC
jgi:hypothetical protein